MPKLSIESAVSAFGLEAKVKLSAIAAKGEPEDQLRNPLEQLVAAMTELCGQVRSKLALIGESSLSELHTRPESPRPARRPRPAPVAGLRSGQPPAGAQGPDLQVRLGQPPAAGQGAPRRCPGSRPAGPGRVRRRRQRRRGR